MLLVQLFLFLEDQRVGMSLQHEDRREEGYVGAHRYVSQHNEHKEMADLGYKLKDIDKTKANEDPTMSVLVLDLQQVLDTPSLTANVSFYKRLLSTFNLTIRDCTTDGGITHCYMWNEAIEKRGSEDIASCVLKKLESLHVFIICQQE
ncbi:hypothetical protein PR048_015312 [Dryococelus australis]|uniref:Uncharacterized protein n=1 Tax=Dryococelus australis TaxID=614101 RepID=A0ABQ9HGK9_9NEOP|nr:hypothetical protein PR048_015312 [Dryococelus australis]